jgi:hypothetical protein
MLMRTHSATGLLAMVLIAAGCQTHAGRTADGTPQTIATAAQLVPDQWLGRWDGPEGTFLNLSRNGAKYTVVIQDLDGPRSFDGVDDHGHVRFVRDGKTEFLIAGDGHASGMKWLADKRHCLLTRPGEGWCRD